MMRYRQETPSTTDAAQVAILLVNLGTPEAPTKAAVRTYLKEFLGDPRVVEMPRLLWRPILAYILRTRPAHSAQKYAQIWQPEGSPLKIHTEKQARLLSGYLGQTGMRLTVDYAFRYGKPSIGEKLTLLHRQNCQHILVLPLYPQYSATTTATAFDEVCRWLLETRNQPEIRFVRSYADRPDYIEALNATVRHHWFSAPLPGKGYRLLMSFHGMPCSAIDAGDPYLDECRRTATLLAESLRLRETDWQITFQSRFGRKRWLEPGTAQTLQSLARDGIDRVDVICPGFAADCLETLEEIALVGKDQFLQAGGREFNVIPCLNENDKWIKCLAGLAEQYLAGWPVHKADSAQKK